LNRVLQLEEEVRRMRGQLDEQANASRRGQEDLAKQIGDLNFRLQNAASAGPASPAVAPGAPPPSSGGSAPSGPPPRRTPELAMQEGNAALARRDYTAAEAAAREVLGAGRTSARAADANFLLAQSQLGQRNYQGAAVAYDDAYNRARTGSRAPDALLGLANALTGLNERPAACATLDKLRTEFPSQRSPIRDAAAALRTRNGCR
jgi:TolA-binding protein